MQDRSAPRILLVDDEADIRDLIGLALQQRKYVVKSCSTAEDALEELRANLDQYDVVVTDVRLGDGMDGIELCARIHELSEDIPVVLVTAFGDIHIAVGAIRAGAYDFATKPLKLDELDLILQRAVHDRRLRNEVHHLSEILASAKQVREIVGQDTRITKLFELIEAVSELDSTVLISGESGTGKELVARAIHDRSTRTGPFVAVNCAAVPAELLESELFGHVKGAFTDAGRSRQGLLCRASGGTLFLDEIGEMPLSMQVKLLRVLQERSVRPVGGDHEQTFDTRIVCATNRNLEDEVEKGNFRQDLFYRINVVPVEVPPLRERGDDILLLAQKFVERAAAATGKVVTGISSSAATKLLEYDWPGNVRELENAMERAVTLTRFEQIRAEDLPDRIREHGMTGKIVPPWTAQKDMPTLDEVDRRYVTMVLQAVDWNKTRTAQILGVDRRTLYRRLERLGIDGSPPAPGQDAPACPAISVLET